MMFFSNSYLEKTMKQLPRVPELRPSIQDGCGGAVALLVGEKLFTAVCGKCELAPWQHNGCLPLTCAQTGNKRASERFFFSLTACREAFDHAKPTHENHTPSSHEPGCGRNQKFLHTDSYSMNLMWQDRVW